MSMSMTSPSAITTVQRVIDGDTFVTATGEKVRVLGIDSCEMATPGGRSAKEAAEVFLPVGAVVTMTSEPGVDKDSYGRSLRYVQTPLGDLGEGMVVYDHTAVYAGKNDASAAYVNKLRTVYDQGGRNCSIGPDAPAPATAATNSTPNIDVHHEDNGESWLCKRKRWC
jgi:endonuclease YncB( thermonuclease family)